LRVKAHGKAFVSERAFHGVMGEKKEELMTRSISTLTIIVLASLTLGTAAHAQTTPTSPANCGVETWSTDKMTYVSVPCTGEQPSGQTANAPAAASCGVETWSTDKMMYVGTPCPAGITYENPASPTK
jgi:hypothetical protein